MCIPNSRIWIFCTMESWKNGVKFHNPYGISEMEFLSRCFKDKSGTILASDEL
jgi:hypothetical protein